MSLVRPQFLIGAAASGSGKTTFTMGLLRVLKRRGMHVQPFKCGPDYIDGSFMPLLQAGNLSIWTPGWPRRLMCVTCMHGMPKTLLPVW